MSLYRKQFIVFGVKILEILGDGGDKDTNERKKWLQFNCLFFNVN